MMMYPHERRRPHHIPPLANKPWRQQRFRSRTCDTLTHRLPLRLPRRVWSLFVGHGGINTPWGRTPRQSGNIRIAGVIFSPRNDNLGAHKGRPQHHYGCRRLRPLARTVLTYRCGHQGRQGPNPPPPLHWNPNREQPVPRSILRSTPRRRCRYWAHQGVQSPPGLAAGRAGLQRNPRALLSCHARYHSASALSIPL